MAPTLILKECAPLYEEALTRLLFLAYLFQLLSHRADLQDKHD